MYRVVLYIADIASQRPIRFISHQEGSDMQENNSAPEDHRPWGYY